MLEKKGSFFCKKQQQPGRLVFDSELRGLCRLPPTPLLSPSCSVGKEKKERQNSLQSSVTTKETERPGFSIDTTAAVLCPFIDVTL